MAVFKPNESADDASIWLTSISLNSLWQFLGKDGGGDAWDNGIRFYNVTIPKGSTILSAKITFNCQEVYDDIICNVRIKGEKVDNAAIFTSHSDFDGRTRTTEYKDWSSIPAWLLNTDYDSPDISNVIQEIINRAGWASGNYLVLFIADNGSNVAAGRYVKSWNSSTTYCARLTVTWSEGAGNFFQLF